MTSKNKMWGFGKNVVLLKCIPLKRSSTLNGVLYTQLLYVNFIVTTNQKPVIKTQHIKRKESKRNTKESHQSTRKGAREEERDR